MTDAPVPVRSLYHVSRAYFARALGRVASVAAVLVLLATLGLALDASGILTVVAVVLGTIALVVTAIVSVSVMMPPTLLQLDQHGFRAGRRYSSGRRQAAWEDVSSVASQEGPQGWVLMIQHHGHEFTAVPLHICDATPTQIEQDVRQRLDAAHGYRPMPEGRPPEQAAGDPPADGERPPGAGQ